MPEETLFEFEGTQTRAEIADRLRSLADGLDDGPLALAEGDQRVTLTPPERPGFELEVEREYEEGDDDGEEGEEKSGELSIEVEIEWDESDADAGSGEQRSADRKGGEASGGDEDAETETVGTGSEDDRDDSTEAAPIEPDQEGVPAAATGEIETAQSLGQFQLYVDRGGKWRWRLVHRNGNIIAASGQGYASKQKARQGMESVMRNAPDAEAIITE